MNIPTDVPTALALLALGVALALGLALGATLSDGPAECREDEVALWPMERGRFVDYRNTECVPLNRI